MTDFLSDNIKRSNFMRDIVLGVWIAAKYKAGLTLPKRLLDKFGTFENIYRASADDYINAGFSISEVSPLLGKSTDYAKGVCEFCANTNTDIILYGDEKYPKILYDMPDCPLVLFCKGDISSINKHACVTMVGTRNMTPDGALIAHRISFEAASRGAVIISGFAKGIDTVSHSGALDADGLTVAVLGCGIDVEYPLENMQLKQRILSSKGAVITQFFPTEEPKASNFPIRNKLLSALSHCTAVIEAPLGSGALLTASYANAQGKKVYTVPGSIMQPTFEGNNYLLKEGIGAVLDVQDILQGLSVLFPNTSGIHPPEKEYFIPPELAKAVNDMSRGSIGKSKPTVSRADELDGIHREIYEKILKGDVRNAEELVGEGMSLGKTLYVLTQLEANGFINVIPGGGYTVKNT